MFFLFNFRSATYVSPDSLLRGTEMTVVLLGRWATPTRWSFTSYKYQITNYKYNRSKIPLPLISRRRRQSLASLRWLFLDILSPLVMVRSRKSQFWFLRRREAESAKTQNSVLKVIVKTSFQMFWTESQRSLRRSAICAAAASDPRSILQSTFQNTLNLICSSGRMACR